MGPNYLHLGCTIRNPQAGSSPQTCYIWSSKQFKTYRKFLLNDADFMNEFFIELLTILQLITI